MKRIKSLLSIFVILSIVTCSIFTYIINVSADNTIIYNWQKMGVNRANKDATNEEYYAEGVVNLRCGYSSWDSKKQYLWLISNWDSNRNPSSLYMGSDYDMSQITSITFDYVTNKTGSLNNNRVSLTKDAEGTQVVAVAQITENTTANLQNPKNLQMEIIDSTYKGDVYLYIEYQTKMFVGNLKITGTDSFAPSLPGKAGLPEKTMVPTVTQAPDIEFAGNDSGYKPESDEVSIVPYVIGAGAVLVVMAVALVFIWKKKQ